MPGLYLCRYPKSPARPRGADVDVWLAMQQKGLSQAGDHVIVKHGKPNSWADGIFVVLGEDAIDFDITLQNISASNQTATFLVRHVPPAQSDITLPADWMRRATADVPNNWVQVTKRNDGKYAGAVGKETFDVEITISRVNGKILSARMDNLVEVLERECRDTQLRDCGEESRYQIARQIEISDLQ